MILLLLRPLQLRILLLLLLLRLLLQQVPLLMRLPALVQMVQTSELAIPPSSSKVAWAEDLVSSSLHIVWPMLMSKATEFTFQSQDPVIEANQQEALNPNIITNRICDELTNICGANDAAKTLCESAQGQIQALGTRDVTTAETWNELLGFAGTVTNPDGGAATPDDVVAAKMRMRRRSFRA